MQTSLYIIIGVVLMVAACFIPTLANSLSDALGRRVLVKKDKEPRYIVATPQVSGNSRKGT
jgi:hypothetical protein